MSARLKTDVDYLSLVASGPGKEAPDAHPYRARTLAIAGGVIFVPVIWYFALILALPLSLIGGLRAIIQRRRVYTVGQVTETEPAARNGRLPRWTLGRMESAVAAVVVGGSALAVLHMTLGLCAQAAMAALASAAGALSLGVDHSRSLARRFRPELERLTRIAPPREPITLRVISVQGDCAWDYGRQQAWFVASGGAVMPPICRAASDAFATTRTMGPTDHHDGEFGCECPLQNREVRFAWEINRAALAA